MKETARTYISVRLAAVIVIGIEPGWTKRVVDGIAATGKPVEGFAIEQHGDNELWRHSRLRWLDSTAGEGAVVGPAAGGGTGGDGLRGQIYFEAGWCLFDDASSTRVEGRPREFVSSKK